mmetsp:Transcript_39660/g.71374  ORF Transcript_39660/g.71374 Transcript_39660/m.71374 type:complete len:220 (+) Transcript_39660:213-872(+)
MLSLLPLFVFHIHFSKLRLDKSSRNASRNELAHFVVLLCSIGSFIILSSDGLGQFSRGQVGQCGRIHGRASLCNQAIEPCSCHLHLKIIPLDMPLDRSQWALQGNCQVRKGLCASQTYSPALVFADALGKGFYNAVEIRRAAHQTSFGDLSQGFQGRGYTALVCSAGAVRICDHLQYLCCSCYLQLPWFGEPSNGHVTFGESAAAEAGTLTLRSVDIQL